MLRENDTVMNLVLLPVGLASRSAWTDQVHMGHNLLHFCGLQSQSCTCFVSLPPTPPALYHPLKAACGVRPSIPQRAGQSQSASGCSFATLWQWAIQEGVNIPTCNRPHQWRRQTHGVDEPTRMISEPKPAPWSESDTACEYVTDLPV